MNNSAGPSKSKINETINDNDFLEDSLFLANFVDSSFKEKNRFSESHINDSPNKSALNISALCCDEEISGYDKLTGQTWIYPTNYPVRDYQFNIIKSAILKNTLVSLPTGLGKTFIAAVIMYNFYRWYPLGKIVFTAPTRPLVAQQIEACYNIIAIPPNDTIEMTGHMQVNTRKTHWQCKRVFFATPQVIYNDIMSGICPGDKIRCLVIDEAHRARGNYAYCQIVGSLTDKGHKTFRLLALSATPGSKVDDVINVVKNLHIAHLELRTENCIDVAPYSHARKINTVIVQLGPELSQLRQQYIEILDGYARRLKQCNILPHNLGNLSKGRVVMLYKEYQNKDRAARHPQHNHIMKDFTILIALYHGLELLIKHGSRVFLNFFDEHPEKSWMQADDRLTALLERLRDDLGVNPLSLNRSILPDGTIPEMPKDLFFGHPKFIKLKEIMMEHFVRAKQNGQDTKAIVFCEYRESVNLVHCLLLQCRPLITPQMFVGQGASGKDGKTVISQKQQLRVMRSFREGACNTLVATCVAEEGLDVGSVDIIICFDISSRSPIRLVQRCGRTGRERGGQVFILVTEGREHQTLLDCMRQRDGLNKKILQSREVESNLYKNNPRMVPHDFTPKCQKMYITVAKKHDLKEKKDGIEKAKKGQKDLRSMLLGKTSSSSSSSSKEFEVSNLITEAEFNEIFPNGFHSTTRFAESMEYWAMRKDEIQTLSKTTNQNEIKLHAWLDWQRSLQKTVNIDHSTDSVMLASLLRYGDAKRFNMSPSTQNPVFNTQEPGTQHIITASPAKPKQAKKKPAVKSFPAKSPGKKDGDIRALFSTATKSTKSYTKLINDLGIQNNGDLPTQLINLLVDLSLDNANTTKPCYICQSICDCNFITKIRQQKKQQPVATTLLIDPKLPNLDLLDDMDTNSLLKYHKSIQESQDLNNPNIGSSLTDIDKNCSGNFDLEFDFSSPEHYELHKNNEDTVTNENGNNSKDELKFDILSPDHELIPSNTCTENVETNFEIGDIEDIFAESSPEENIQKEITEIENDRTKTKNYENDINKNKEALGFFGLDSIDDIFAEDYSIDNKFPEESIVSKENGKIDQDQEINDRETIRDIENPSSPSILSGRQKSKFPPTSPILCSQVKKFQLSTKKNISHSTPKNEILSRNAFNTSCNGISYTNNKSMFTITQLVDMINKTDNSPSVSLNIDKTTTELVEKKSTSPILLTQADKNQINLSNRSKPCIPPSKSGSLIILDSDSDSADTEIYEMHDEFSNTQKTGIKNNNDKDMTILNPVTSKRKLDFDGDDILTLSPYFNKKQKLNNETCKPLTLQEKVLAALSSNKVSNTWSKNNDSDVRFVISPLKSFSQKENFYPHPDISKTSLNKSDDEKEFIRRNTSDVLQMFRKGSNVKCPKIKFNNILNGISSNIEAKRKLSSDSDDDFVNDIKNYRNPKAAKGDISDASITNHKVRKKKKRKLNEFLELEAELSAGSGDSGDELTDDSTGSLADFICDNTQAELNEDIHAEYLRSIKSPVNGMFKIPQLPHKYNKKQIFSQFVEDDTYEMDSFCVDSHVDLTQANEMSELELAEIILEEERRSKKSKLHQKPSQDNGDSPIVKRKNKNVCQIQSDSDDSS